MTARSNAFLFPPCKLTPIQQLVLRELALDEMGSTTGLSAFQVRKRIWKRTKAQFSNAQFSRDMENLNGWGLLTAYRGRKLMLTLKIDAEKAKQYFVFAAWLGSQMKLERNEKTEANRRNGNKEEKHEADKNED